MPQARVQGHVLARQYSHVVTPLIWRPKEQSPALGALVAHLREHRASASTRACVCVASLL